MRGLSWSLLTCSFSALCGFVRVQLDAAVSRKPKWLWLRCEFAFFEWLCFSCWRFALSRPLSLIWPPTLRSRALHCSIWWFSTRKHTASSAFSPCALQAESNLRDSCAARVFSLLNKMPNLGFLNCHRCAVSSAGVYFLKVSYDFCFASHSIITRHCCFGPLFELWHYKNSFHRLGAQPFCCHLDAVLNSFMQIWNNLDDSGL